ncbi:MAG: glycosyltransferase [Candidatus Sericytochromatia bacterium]|nr:glycosyltransferase [Candidatus Sericytochromatia bacterium]
MARACLHRIRTLDLPADEAPTILQRLQGRPTGGPKAPQPWRLLLTAAAPAPTISACLIVRDQSPRLAQCLTSLQGVDELVVMDTGSNADTVAIATAHGARIGPFLWCDDVSAARNAALAMATADWILVIDAAEVLAGGGIDAVRRSLDLHAGGRQVLAPVITEVGDPTGGDQLPNGRVFARKPGRHFIGRTEAQPVDEGERPLMRLSVDEWTLRRHHQPLDSAV